MPALITRRPPTVHRCAWRKRRRGEGEWMAECTHIGPYGGTLNSCRQASSSCLSRRHLHACRIRWTMERDASVFMCLSGNSQAIHLCFVPCHYIYVRSMHGCISSILSLSVWSIHCLSFPGTRSMSIHIHWTKQTDKLKSKPQASSERVSWWQTHEHSE